MSFYKSPEQFAESSGKINERFVFGSIRVNDPAYEREKRELIQHYRDIKKPIPLRGALEVVKHFQPFKPDSREPADPVSPLKQFPNALRKFIAEELGRSGEKDKNVLFWTTVDSFVDRDYGADAVIEVKGREKESPRLIRLDITLESPEISKEFLAANPDKVVIYGEIPDVRENKKAFDDLVQKIGKEALEKLKAQGLPVMAGK